MATINNWILDDIHPASMSGLCIISIYRSVVVMILSVLDFFRNMTDSSDVT